jgi:molybdopterin adenylyltransferase
LVIEARKLSATIKGVCQGTFTDEEKQLVTDVDAFGYDEAARFVYGVDYNVWKSRHQKKATNQQLAMFKASAHFHARHDKELLEPLCEKGPASHEPPPQQPSAAQITMQHVREESTASPASQDIPTSSSGVSGSGSYMQSSGTYQQQSSPQKGPMPSDVCCEDVDAPVAGNGHTYGSPVASKYRTPSPPKVDLSLRVGILTVSDRASKGEYENGDLSGPAVENSLIDNLKKLNLMRGELDDKKVMLSSVVKSIVGDEIDEIKEQLLQWSGRDGYPSTCDVIFTTGGTGFSTRDITPEATLEVIEKEAHGLMTFVTAQCALIQPLAALSRGTAGICGETIIVNLPGNPRGVGQVLDVLVPLLLHAVKDLKGLS